jgi:DNA polymerase
MRGAAGNRHVPAWGEPVESAWPDVLRDVGYPLDVVVLDLETYFDETYGLKLLTIPEFIAHKKWEVLGLAHLHVGGRNPHVDPDAISAFEVGEAAVASYLKYLQTSYGQDLAGCTVICQNSKFDLMVLAMRYGIHPKYQIDTACLASAYHTRSKHGLADLCRKFGLKAKGETKDFLGCTLRTGRYVMSKGRGRHKKPPEPRPLMTGAQVTALASYACNDAAREFELFTLLLPKLSNPKVELAIQDATLRMATQPVLHCDYDRGRNLVGRMGARMSDACASVGVTADDLSGNLEFDRLLTEAIHAAGDAPMRYMKCMAATKTLPSRFVFGLAKDDSELKALNAHPSDRVRALVKARSAIKSWPLHIARVERIMRMSDAMGGNVCVPLSYHGGHTGRDSGAWSVNLQNLPKRGEPEVVAMRGLLTAAPDQELVIVDLAAIEARVLAWVAGQQDLVEKFARNEEIYCGFASKVLGKPSWKPKKTDPPAVHRIMTERRNLGKVGILGCGYGMGKDRLQEYAAGPFYNLDLTIEEAENVVNTYRNTNIQITGFWRAIEKAFIYTAKYKRPCGLERGIAFYPTKDVDVVVVLSNGRRMNYHRVKLEPGQYNDTAAVYNEVEHCWNHLWGGVLTENLVQAIARDVLMEASLRLNNMGHRTVHRIHDELVISVPKGAGKDVLKLAEAELSRVPVWAPGLPLGAEGVVAERYGLH